jgi:phosphoribosyl-AMP cyclohydrolase
MTSDDFLDQLHWNSDGLVPAIAQDWQSGQVLMLAWMNAESLRRTLEEGRAVYWSRSRERLWRNGETSGNVQVLHDLRLDCDGDTLLLSVEQRGGIACHTGWGHCFFRRLDGRQWQVTDAVLRDPAELYGDGHDD